MTIAERRLHLHLGSAHVPVPIRILCPEADGPAWICRYEIGWPEGVRDGFAAGLDAVQALYFALQRIGIDLYTSPHHASGNLVWEEAGDGYGFPVPKDGRDLLVGSDRLFDG